MVVHPSRQTVSFRLPPPIDRDSKLHKTHGRVQKPPKRFSRLLSGLRAVLISAWAFIVWSFTLLWKFPLSSKRSTNMNVIPPRQPLLQISKTSAPHEGSHPRLRIDTRTEIYKRLSSIGDKDYANLSIPENPSMLGSSLASAATPLTPNSRTFRFALLTETLDKSEVPDRELLKAPTSSQPLAYTSCLNNNIELGSPKGSREGYGRFFGRQDARTVQLLPHTE